MEYVNGQYSNQLSGNAGLAQLGAQACAEDELTKVLREYRDAKYRFDTACQNAQVALGERDNANTALEKLSALVEKLVASNRYDPTVPRAAEPAIPLNNHYSR